MRSINLRLLLSQRSSRSLFWVSTVGAFVGLFFILAHGFLLAQIIVGLIASSDGVAKNIIYLAALWLSRSIFTSSFEFWCSRQALILKREARASVTSQIEQIPQLSPGELSQTLVKALNALDIYYGRFIPQVIAASLTPFAVILVIWFLDHLSGYIALVTIPLIPLFGALIGRFTSDEVASKWGTLGALSGYFEDSLRGFVTLRLFGRSESQHDRIQKMGDEYTTQTMKVLRISFLSAFALELAATLSVAVIAVTIGLRLIESQISFFAAIAVLLLAPEVYAPLRNAASLFHASADGLTALSKINEITPKVEVQGLENKRDFSGIKYIEWQSTHLQMWPTLDSRIDAGRVESGEILFISGLSGSGKSTLALSLLAMRSDCIFSIRTSESTVLLTSTDSEEWLQHVGWISQNPQFPPATIAAQFRACDASLTNDEITAQLLNCGVPISELADGLNTFIGGYGEKAHQVSGGQLRKIALARALIRNPQVVIADEPTADCDAESSEIVMARLRRFARDGGITIVITHDVSLIKDTDKRLWVREMSSNRHG